MILRPQSYSSDRGAALRATATVSPTPVPDWPRRIVFDAQSSANQELEDIAVAAGGVLGALSTLVRRQERWSGAWRQRLALCAAAVAAKQGGRIEDEAALRDAVLLTKLGDDVGPAGHILLAWRRLVGTPAVKLLTAASIGAVLEDLGLAHDNAAVGDLSDELRQLSASTGVVGLSTGALAAAERHGFGRVAGA